jgi:hypothetical protein
MAKYAESDPADREIWQDIHNSWAGLVNAEMEHRGGRASTWYRELLGLVDGRESWSLGSPGSPSSRLTTMQAFERGYAGGWAK